MVNINMLISPNQIRAARGLLDWTVSYLAQKVGVGATTISAIETGRSAGSLEVISAIIYAFQSSGVEFTEEGGVRPRHNKISTYRGHDGFRAFFDDVYTIAKNTDSPDICVTNVKEEEFEHWLGAYEPMHMQRMTALKDVKLRVLMKERDLHLTSSAYCDYRWVPESQFADASLYIYGAKVAFIEFSERDVLVTVVDSQSVTECLRKMFELSWTAASVRPQI